MDQLRLFFTSGKIIQKYYCNRAFLQRSILQPMRKSIHQKCSLKRVSELLVRCYLQSTSLLYCLIIDHRTERLTLRPGMVDLIFTDETWFSSLYPLIAVFKNSYQKQINNLFMKFLASKGIKNHQVKQGEVIKVELL